MRKTTRFAISCAAVAFASLLAGTAVAQQAADAAIQIHGAAGLSDDFPLTQLFAYARVLRLADGPDEVHRGVIAKLEAKAQAHKEMFR